jgi:hypothetical protein
MQQAGRTDTGDIMPERLVDSYAIGQRVAISFVDDERWLPGVVVAHDHPGVWVRAGDGEIWFVTNHRRIRPAAPDEGGSEQG